MGLSAWVALLVVTAAPAAATATAPAVGETIEITTERARIRVTAVAGGLEHPWGLAFLPDGRMLVSERPGRLRLVTREGEVSAPLGGVPEVHATNQGGLLDVALDPRFEHNRLVYLSYAEPREAGTNGTSVARGRLTPRGLEGLTVIFRQQPGVPAGPGHFGSRLVFGRDGRLFVTLGERQTKPNSERAQDLTHHWGKVVRIERDGRVPQDNPFIGRADARPEIWSYGHRNPQGATLHPLTGELWITEHGPRGGDELNIVRAGRNYGWPVITYGLAYSGAPIGIGTAKQGMEQPVHYWVPSIGTSGLSFYSGRRIPQWKGNLFAGGLVGLTLARLELEGEQVVHEERLLGEYRQRVRTVREDQEGYLWVLTDSPEGRLLRIDLASERQVSLICCRGAAYRELLWRDQAARIRASAGS